MKGCDRQDRSSPWIVASISIAVALLAGDLKGIERCQVLVPNGGWCWFQDERIIADGDRVIFGSVKSPQGDVDVHAWNPHSGQLVSQTLQARHESDDHVVPSFLRLPDGRILASWANHGGVQPREKNRVLQWTVTNRPGEIESWEPLSSFAFVDANVTYTSLFALQAEGGRIYNFCRALGNNPTYLVSDDGAATFRFGGRLLSWDKPSRDDPKYTGLDGARPYVKYASNNVDTIHFITTEDHPRAYHNSIWHGLIRGDTIHHTDGRSIRPLSHSAETSIRPTDLTQVFAGDGDNVAWTTDLHLDSRGMPVALFTVQKNDSRVQRDATAGGDDLRYYYARWDGSVWHVHQMAYGGSCLYRGENDYAGLGCLVPHALERVFISTNSDPQSGRPLISNSDGKRHYEIYQGRTADLGKSWTWAPVTQDSSADNLRPICPYGERIGTVVLWLRGKMTTFRDYQLEVVGCLDP